MATHPHGASVSNANNVAERVAQVRAKLILDRETLRSNGIIHGPVRFDDFSDKGFNDFQDWGKAGR